MWTKERALKEKPTLRVWVDGREIDGQIQYQDSEYPSAVWVRWELNGEVEMKRIEWSHVLQYLNNGVAIYP